MKKQVGISIDSQVWDDYRRLCIRENLFLFKPITEFLGLVLRNGSPSAVMNMMQLMVKERIEGFEAYARVLLDWYKNGRTWIHMMDESETAIEPMLLQVLKDVVNSQLRKDIQETLVFRPRGQADRIGRKKKSKENSMPGLAKANIPERIGDIKRRIAKGDMSPEQAQEMLKKIHQIQEKFKKDEKGRTRK